MWSLNSETGQQWLQLCPGIACKVLLDAIVIFYLYIILIAVKPSPQSIVEYFLILQRNPGPWSYSL